ncbi:42076bd4-a4f1-445b-9301-80ad67946f0e [Sclerotinia trifoliorum]|uniref:42076bd4-a4f1-445b-9301-80ad67946f0e n=1 Tax=Sclerotinia trifoliorum TaxID=28548 RepID=A0A8H2ZKD9_9HELO|nr:42076bd4-a4f1-445b-9301-80ad67946f0e [Sclerotinia trifoliorum]
MNDNDKELVKGVLSQNGKVDFKSLTKFLKPELEPDKITRAMVESTRLRYKGLKERLGLASATPATPDPSPKKPPKKEGGRGRKRKAHIEDDTAEASSPSPSKKKDKGQAKAVVNLEGSDKEDNAFQDAMFAYEHHDEA